MKQRVYPVLGFKRFGNATVTISGIELAHRIKEEQSNTSGLRLEVRRAQDIREAVLAA